MRAGLGLFEAYIGYTMTVDQGLAGEVYRTGRPVNVDDYHAFTGRSPDFDGTSIGAVLGVPLTSKGRVVGVIGLASGSDWPHLARGRGGRGEPLRPAGLARPGERPPAGGRPARPGRPGHGAPGR